MPLFHSKHDPLHIIIYCQHKEEVHNMSTKFPTLSFSYYGLVRSSHDPISTDKRPQRRTGFSTIPRQINKIKQSGVRLRKLEISLILC